MYQFKRLARIQEEIQLGDEVLKVDLDADTAVNNFRRVQVELLNAQQKVKELAKKKVAPEEVDAAMQAYGEAIVAALKFVFGEDNAVKILDFYENNYTEMAEEVFPFIINVIYPQLDKALKAKKGKIKKQYRGKWRR